MNIEPRVGVALATLSLLLAGHVSLSLAAAGPAAFKSPEAASNALFVAVNEHDEHALKRILGGEVDLLGSDDEKQNGLDRERFVRKYHEMHRLSPQGKTEMILYVGAENWPFPLPIVSHDGLWRFDPEAGMQEMTYRRIGANEIEAVALSRALAAASANPQTARPPVDTVLTTAANDKRAGPFSGYYFRIRSDSRQGFAAVAFPAEYGSSGVMTFIVDQSGRVRQKDLGSDTAKAAAAIDRRAVDSDSTWRDADAAEQLEDNDGGPWKDLRRTPLQP